MNICRLEDPSLGTSKYQTTFEIPDHPHTLGNTRGQETANGSFDGTLTVDANSPFKG
jgi:hypothetical protein